MKFKIFAAASIPPHVALTVSLPQLFSNIQFARQLLHLHSCNSNQQIERTFGKRNMTSAALSLPVKTNNGANLRMFQAHQISNRQASQLLTLPRCKLNDTTGFFRPEPEPTFADITI
jgi:hypothetical protein